MSPRRRRHHLVNVNWVQIAIRTRSPITVEEARRIAVRAYLNTIDGKLGPGEPSSR